MTLDQKLPKEEKLLDFTVVFKEGKWRRGKCCAIYYRQKGNRKLGVAVTRKIKKTVVKNRMKRILREIYRKNKKIFDREVVLMALQPAQSADYETIEKEIINLMEQINE